MTNYPKILIVGTTPYHPNEASRALDTYFHNWPKENLRMIFSNVNTPIKWNYSSLYQITDYDVLDVYKRKTKVAGRVLNYDQLNDEIVESDKTSLNRYKKKNNFRYYARKFLWKRKRWISRELCDWVEEFQPQAIYICFSDDYFILDIAYYFADKHNIPVIAQIGDDYYFKKSNLFLKPYISKYKKIFNKIMSLDGFGVYISQKLADKYNSFFKLQGCPFYLASNIVNNDSPIKYEFNYFGKLELGRYKSLCLLGDALNQINNNYVVNVYSGETSNKIVDEFKKHHCAFKGSLSYRDVMTIMNSGSFNIVASGFSKKDIEASRYSLSTKVSDSLASSGPIIAIGPEGDGAIDFLKENKCAIVLDSKTIDINALNNILKDEKLLKEIINKAHSVSKQLFDTNKNISLFENKCRDITK